MDAGKKDKKPENRRQKANPLSALTFAWTIPTFCMGYKRDLEVQDLPEALKEHRSERLGDKLAIAWEQELHTAAKRSRKPSLRRAIVRVFGLEVMLYGLVLAFVEIGIRLQQPLYLGMLVRYFDNNAKINSISLSDGNSTLNDTIVAAAKTVTDAANTTMMQPMALGQLLNYYSPNSDMTKAEAYLYAGAVIGCSLISVFVNHPYMLAILHMGMKMRVACCSLIYRKALKLSKTALGQTTVGQVVNLLSNDVNRFDIGIIFLHYLWVGPLETVFITYLMYQQVGISAVIGVVFLLLFIPLQGYLGKRSSILRLKTALRTDERVRLMNEIISGIQVIKMYTWEKPFEKLVALARKNEIDVLKATAVIRGIIMSFIMFITRIAIFVSVLAFVLMGNNINAERVFVITSYYNVLRQTMTVFFPQGIALLAETQVSINRLQKFLLYDETELSLEDKRSEKEKIADKKLVGGELTKQANGKIESPKGVVLKNATAKWTQIQSENTLSNINLKVSPGRLVAVIGPVGSGKSSLLHAVLQELPLISGSVEVTGVVSYASQEPWLFAGSVRQNILFGLPMDKKRYRAVVKTCSLERDFTLFPYADKTIVGERGVSLSGGQRARINLARAVYKEADVYLLDDPLSAVDAHVGRELFEKCIRGYLREKTVILITHQLQYLKEVDQIVILNGGVLEAEGGYQQLRDTGLDFAQMLQDTPEKGDAEDTKAIATTEKLQFNRQNSVQSVGSYEERTVDEPQEVQEQRSEGKISGDVYKGYFKAGGNCCIIFTMFVLFVLAQIAASAGDYFITYWVNIEEEMARKNQTIITQTEATTDAVNATQVEQEDDDSLGMILSRNTCIYIYSGITVATVVITLWRSFTFFLTCMRASRNLHNVMFAGITRATMRFFNTNPSGRILNRFSKDMGAVDEQLPSALIDCLQIGLALIGIIVVVGVVNPWLMIPTFIIGFIFLKLRNFYIATSRSIKRLEGITRSPVFGHLNASVQGLTTIRAFQAQNVLEKEFDSHQDLHSSAWFLFIASSRAFGFWLDLVCIVYIAIVTLSFLVIGSEQFGGNVGLAITQSIALTGMFQWGMRQSTELENQMTSVERILEYSTLEEEPPLVSPPDRKPPVSWPERGHIKFENVSLRYAPTEPPVLKNLCFAIQPKEKVGIVGRTGAGKSSLIAALFRLTETDGCILIDGRDTKHMGLHELRSKISIIPQEPVLFSGTMRKNLDPFDEFSDNLLWKALEEVELKQAVQELAGGLNTKMSEGGSNFSVGQRQLVCLARAIVRNNKVLVLDEATANVDPQTDVLIQQTIRTKFAECTVLTIAHRLNTVMDSDKVLVMDAGEMVEFRHPYQLLRDTEGFLYGLVQQTGDGSAEQLMRIAEESYNKLQQAAAAADQHT